MKKFQFRLENMLRITESARDRCREELAASRRVEEELQQRLARLRAERLGLQQECREAAGPGKVDVFWLKDAHHYALSLLEQEDQWLRKLEIAANEIDRRREALVEAERKVQVLEKLRERRKQLFTREQERQDAKQLDEVALLTVGR
jgi:flagellar FliJ protein